MKTTVFYNKTSQYYGYIEPLLYTDLKKNEFRLINEKLAIRLGSVNEIHMNDLKQMSINTEMIIYIIDSIVNCVKSLQHKTQNVCLSKDEPVVEVIDTGVKKMELNDNDKFIINETTKQIEQNIISSSASVDTTKKSLTKSEKDLQIIEMAIDQITTKMVKEKFNKLKNRKKKIVK